MNPLMLAAAGLGAVLLMMNRGRAAPGPADAAVLTQRQARTQQQALQLVDPFETAGDDARVVTDLGPAMQPGPGGPTTVQPGDRNGVAPRAEPLVTAEVRVLTGPNIVAVSAMPTIR